jgi:hypothetical protein
MFHKAFYKSAISINYNNKITMPWVNDRLRIKKKKKKFNSGSPLSLGSSFLMMQLLGGFQSIIYSVVNFDLQSRCSFFKKHQIKTWFGNLENKGFTSFLLILEKQKCSSVCKFICNPMYDFQKIEFSIQPIKIYIFYCSSMLIQYTKMNRNQLLSINK